MQNGPKVARYLARFLRFLIQNGIDISKIHLIGFSLGAEVAGFAGKILKEWNMELPRITGELKTQLSNFTTFAMRNFGIKYKIRNSSYVFIGDVE